jgi:YD repeat-containing protein
MARGGANVFDDNNRQTQRQGRFRATTPTAIHEGGTSIASFQYDAGGRRVGRTEGGVVTSYLYDGADAVQETQGTTVNPILTGAGADQRFARNDAVGRTYFLTDQPWAAPAP